MTRNYTTIFKPPDTEYEDLNSNREPSNEKIGQSIRYIIEIREEMLEYEIFGYTRTKLLLTSF